MDKNLFVLLGPVGSGKTEFAKGFGTKLQIKEEITSPTFSIKADYESMVHYDIYNTTKYDSKSILRMVEEDLDSGKKVILEWGEKISVLSSLDPVYIKFEITGENDRFIEVK